VEIYFIIRSFYSQW